MSYCLKTVKHYYLLTLVISKQGTVAVATLKKEPKYDKQIIHDKNI